MKNTVVSLIGPFNVIGRSLEITVEKQGKNDVPRTAAIGNLGKTG